jgi:hypothetical protein
MQEVCFMNDFTKDELQYIADCVDFGIPNKEINDKFLHLDEKIQSMIDNYCKHEWIYARGSKQGLSFDACQKCELIREINE